MAKVRIFACIPNYKYMKNILVSALILVFAASAITSCDKDGGDEPEAKNQIIVTTPTEGEFTLFLAGNGTATINWGDGSADESVTLIAMSAGHNLDESHLFEHNYIGGGTKNVIVTGDITGIYTGRHQTVNGIDVSEMPGLVLLDCGNARNLTFLILGRNTALEELSCFGCRITSLDVSRCTSLTTLSCEDNELTGLKLDVSKCPGLERMDCSGNDLASLTLGTHNALTWLDCCNNELSKLDVSKCPALEWLDCHGNALTSLTLGTHGLLTELHCNYNEIETLNVSKCPALDKLMCYNNALTSLKLGTHNTLTDLHCYNNKITALDASGGLKIRRLVCSNNALTSLTVNSNPELELIYCENNNMNRSVLVKIFEELTDRTNNSHGAIYCGGDVHENPGYSGLTDGDRAIATGKNWTIKNYRQ